MNCTSKSLLTEVLEKSVIVCVCGGGTLADRTGYTDLNNDDVFIKQRDHGNKNDVHFHIM